MSRQPTFVIEFLRIQVRSSLALMCLVVEHFLFVSSWRISIFISDALACSATSCAGCWVVIPQRRAILMQLGAFHETRITRRLSGCRAAHIHISSTSASIKKERPTSLAAIWDGNSGEQQAPPCSALHPPTSLLRFYLRRRTCMASQSCNEIHS